MYQEPPAAYGHSGSPLNKTGKAEVDLFPALADRKALSVVAPRAACNGPEISMFEPTAYEDALDIVECLRSRASTTICLDKMRKTEASRLVDFISGASAAIDGNFHQLSDQVYIFTPSNVRIMVISKDEKTDAAQEPTHGGTGYGGTSSGVPMLNNGSLDLLYPNTGNQSIIDNIWTKHPN